MTSKLLTNEQTEDIKKKQHDKKVAKTALLKQRRLDAEYQRELKQIEGGEL